MSEKRVLFGLKEVGVSYEASAGDRPPTIALDGVSLVAHEGDFVLLSGQNGSGKTTLLGVLAGRVPVTAGRCELWNSRTIDPADLPRNLSVCTVLQDQSAGIVPGLTVADHLAFRFLAPAAVSAAFPTRPASWYPSRPRSRGEALSLAADRLRRIPMLAYLAERVGDLAEGLSGGWKQVLQVAACILAVPDILLLDEPTSHISEVNRPIVEQLISEYARSPLVVLVSHAEIGASIAGRVNVRWQLSDGKLIETSPRGTTDMEATL